MSQRKAEKQPKKYSLTENRYAQTKTIDNIHVLNISEYSTDGKPVVKKGELFSLLHYSAGEICRITVNFLSNFS